MAEKRQDYAEAAAAEWIAERFGFKADHCDACKADVAKLAAIIRNHVEEYKYQHSWSCDDKECCPS